MWILPTYGRPGRCQDALDSIIAAGVSTSGVVWVDGDQDPAYRSLRLPQGWQLIAPADNLGVCGVLNWALARFAGEPWYGFISDDSIVQTPGWDMALVKAAGAAGFANSADGWQAQRRMHGAVVFGGDLLRALGWWAPPGLIHSFVDDAWEKIARALDNWRHVPQVMVEHRHARNAKAPNDASYRKAYSTFEDDRAAFRRLMVDEIPAAIARAIPVVVGDDERRRLARAKSRSVMIATPIARHPCWQYTLALTDTVLALQEAGIPHARQFVLGSSNLPRARNELVARFLASACTDLLFIDDDMGWKPESVIRLLASDKPVAGVVGRKKVEKPNTDPEVWCFSPDCGDDGTAIVQDDMGFVRVKRVGTGFLKIARQAFEQIIAAHPDWKRAGHAGMSDAVKASYHRFFAFGDDEHETGEDFLFCNAWRELGGEIWIDPEQELSHVGEKAYAGAISELMTPAKAHIPFCSIDGLEAAE